MADFRKDIKHLIKDLEAQGYNVEARKGKFRLYNSEWKFLAQLPGTPSDSRSLKNTISRLKHKGITVES